MLVKSKQIDHHIADLKEAFDILRQYRMKLNPTKCAFGVFSKKFLSFMVNHQRIEANPDKIKVVMDMKPLKNLKQF